MKEIESPQSKASQKQKTITQELLEIFAKKGSKAAIVYGQTSSAMDKLLGNKERK